MSKKIFKGKVIKNSTDKTIIVDIERRFMDKQYKKFIKRNKKYAVHDEENKCKVGDNVEIIESKPISKTKRFVLFNQKELKKVKK